ncbi:MAG: tRNA 2-thiouridine(34) synthase MnmA [Thermoanaerobaculia bacterium]|nr:tRNA 2-thiouridine(34) synthase MnmA [Thermoanaerobaculia bacterium]
MNRTALLLSGGVDSSVALHRLLADGHDVTAFYLKIWLEDELSYLGECPWEDDLAFARQVCDEAGIELRVVPLQRAYRERVVTWALDELRAGRTPSPDVLCNRVVKFGAFLDLLDDRSSGPSPDEDGRYDFVASGHYARLCREANGTTHLLRGVDLVKDQTYFLFQLRQAQLQRVLFPIGDLHKHEVRREAERLRLPNRTRKDSQGLCFLGKIQFARFVEAHLGEHPGPIRHVKDGTMLGEHRGHWFHTVGQRKGLGLHGGPWYVVGKALRAPDRDDVIWICHAEELADHARNRFRLGAPHWIVGEPEPGNLSVRVRHGPKLLGARLLRALDGLEIELEEPDPGLAPGQVAVLYRDEECLGGGSIEWHRSEP